MRREKRAREANHTGLNNREQIEDWWREVNRGQAKWVMGIKAGTYYDERWVLYLGDESLNSIPETNITLYVN